MKNTKIRELILASDSSHIKVTIKRDGQIVVRTNRQRGDGGPTPWNMYWGDRTDAVRQFTQTDYHTYEGRHA
jgi:hypothetical protein